MEYYSAAIDIRNSLSLRRLIITIEIGRLLSQLSEQFIHYDKDVAVVQAVEREIQVMREAAKQNSLDINFNALEYGRSTNHPELGESFYEKHQFIIPDVQEHVQIHDRILAAAKHFFDDPFSLKEHRLSRFFSVQKGSLPSVSAFLVYRL